MRPAKMYRLARDFIDYLLAFKRREFTGLTVRAVSNHAELLLAKKLHAKVYKDRNFVKPSDMTPSGMLSTKKDPYQGHAIYFLVTDNKTGAAVATARQILALPQVGQESFPLIKYMSLYPRARRLISQHEPQYCVEISGLAKKHGASKMAPLLLYRAMWHFSLKQGHTLWLLTCDARLFTRLKLLFGPAIQRVGHTNFYLGSDVVPAVLRVNVSVNELRHSLATATGFARPLRLRVVRFLLKGLPVDTLNPRQLRALKDIGKRFNVHP